MSHAANSFVRPDYGYSAGPFTRVEFCMKADCGVMTYPILVPKYRNGVDDKGSLVTTITTVDSGRRACDIYRVY